MDKKKYVFEYSYGNLDDSTKIESLLNIHYEFIKDCLDEYSGGKYLEIGTSWGHSAIAAYVAIKPSRMVLCDLFQDKKAIKYTETMLKILNCESSVMFLIGDSHKTLPSLNEKFDVILVDGDHSNDGARKDLEIAWKLLNDNGIIIFDDIEKLRLLRVVQNFVKNKEDSLKVTYYGEWKAGIAVLIKKVGV